MSFSLSVFAFISPLEIILLCFLYTAITEYEKHPKNQYSLMFIVFILALIITPIVTLYFIRVKELRDEIKQKNELLDKKATEKVAVIFGDREYPGGSFLMTDIRLMLSRLGWRVLTADIDYNDSTPAAGLNSYSEYVSFQIEHYELLPELFLCQDYVFISQGSGTAVATAYANLHDLHCRQIFLSPVPDAFPSSTISAISFIGELDTVSDVGTVKELCMNQCIGFHVIGGANHYLETLREGYKEQNRLYILDSIEEFLNNSDSAS